MAVALLFAIIVSSIFVLRDEWRVSASERAIESQTLALAQGDRSEIAFPDGDVRSAPPRMQAHYALFAARRAQQATLPEQRQMLLGKADAAIDMAISARPHWGEAWTVKAYIALLNGGAHSPMFRAALRHSYDGSPYLRYAALWRIKAGFILWSQLPKETQADVLREAIWLAHLSPRERPAIFAAARKSDAYGEFLLTWRTLRAGDRDQRRARESIAPQ